jgi:hypothetical protein
VRESSPYANNDQTEDEIELWRYFNVPECNVRSPYFSKGHPEVDPESPVSTPDVKITSPCDHEDRDSRAILGARARPYCAFEMAARIPNAVADIRVPTVTQHVSLSMGIAVLPDHAIDAVLFGRAANRALYELKNAKRDRTEISSTDLLPARSSAEVVTSNGAIKLPTRTLSTSAPRGQDHEPSVSDGIQGIAALLWQCLLSTISESVLR